VLNRLSIDSRRTKPGDVFIALRTDQADGHDFVGEAFEKGAISAFVCEKWYSVNGQSYPRGSFIVVEDTLVALQLLAKSHRKRFRLPVIGLTGSNGKTSTKELLAAALNTQFKVLKSPGNYNNHIGIPLTLLNIDPRTEMVILEMGANRPGDIALLCSIAKPEYGLALNVAPAHLQGFGDLQGVAHEKGELLRALPPSGAAFINSDDNHVNQMKTGADQRFCFGFDIDAPGIDCTRMICAENLGLDDAGLGSFQLRGTKITMNWHGLHQITNGLAAAAVAEYFGIPVELTARKFAAMPPIEGRLKVEVISGITLIDDAYNANRESTLKALDYLVSINVPGKRYVVLGDHLELGDASESEHDQLGRSLSERDIDGVFLIGQEVRHAADVLHDKLILHHEDPANITPTCEIIREILQPGDAILIKGSRGIGLDRVVKDVRKFRQEVED